MTPSFDCAVCGQHHPGEEPHNICRYCHQPVCDDCWFTQKHGRGHEFAEHKHEMAREHHVYYRGDEDGG